MKRILGALRRGKVMLLALMVALTFGAVSTAIGHGGSSGLFHRNHSNTVNNISTFVGSVAGPILRLDNNNANGTALDLQVEPNSPPMTINSSTKVTNLNADELDGQDASAFVQQGAAAGGDLTGIYPNPSIAPNAVASNEVQDGSLRARDAFTLSGTVSVDPPNVGPNSCVTTSVPIPGAQAGDLGLLFPTLNFSATFGRHLTLYTHREVNRNGVLFYTVCNVSATAHDAPEGLWGFLISRP
jgi:hypothetical protein